MCFFYFCYINTEVLRVSWLGYEYASKSELPYFLKNIFISLLLFIPKN